MDGDSSQRAPHVPGPAQAGHILSTVCATFEHTPPLTPPASPGGPWSEDVLYAFGNSPGDGIGPSTLLIGNDGVLYGTTLDGGAYGYGTVFSLTPPASNAGSWTETVLWSFGNTPYGGQPLGLVA